MDYLKEIYELMKNDQIQIWILISSLLSTLLWGVYVFFTIKTFKQIKKQTDLQSRAFLLVTPKTNSIVTGIELNTIATELSQKWHRILENNLPATLSEIKTLDLELTNRGKSDIISWSIDITARIDEGEYLNKKLAIYGDNSNWIINSKSDQTIAPNQTIKVPIIEVGDFPRINFYWIIRYTDLMEGSYQTGSKTNAYSHSNLIAFDYKD